MIQEFNCTAANSGDLLPKLAQRPIQAVDISPSGIQLRVVRCGDLVTDDSQAERLRCGVWRNRANTAVNTEIGRLPMQLTDEVASPIYKRIRILLEQAERPLPSCGVAYSQDITLFKGKTFTP